MGNREKEAKILRKYVLWQILTIVMLVFIMILLSTIDSTASIIMLIFIVVYSIMVLTYYFFKKPSIVKELIEFSNNYNKVQSKLIKELRLPYGILDYEGKFLWGNDEFYELIDSERQAQISITNIFKEVKKDEFPKDIHDTTILAERNERNYRIVLRKISLNNINMDEFADLSDNIKKQDHKNDLIAMYVYDITEITVLERENKEQKMIIGLLYIDNYEEVIGNTEDVRRSLLAALIDRKINKYMQNIDAIVKKLEKDKFIFMFKQKYLPYLQSNKFNLLEEVRNVNIGNKMAVTISIGLGVHPSSYKKAYDYALASIDLALGRGGDQAVIKSGEKVQYYGGKSIHVGKTTRVKARVKAHALKELIETQDKVVVMGHSIQDVDSFGASIGIYCIAKALNKKAHVVINEVTNSVRPFMTQFVNSPEYEEDMFMQNPQAIEVVDNNTVLVIVDVNKPVLTECEELLNMTNTIVILDHHRQTGEAIENASLSYIEPYASSTCEMVAEILQYIGDGIKLNSLEADAMYAGIMIDTNNFLTKTGVRTFEAAAFLKRNGANVTGIRKAFRTDMEEYRLKARAMGEAQIYLDSFAIASLPENDEENPTIIGAQVANELLNVIGVKASFVLSEYNNKIYVSARSMDEVNVQIIMEKLGGGGHLSSAGTQFEDMDIEDAITKIKDTIKTMWNDGDL